MSARSEMLAKTSNASTQQVSATRLAVDNLAVGHGNKTVLLVESMSLAASEVVTIVGPSGAGKTTFLRSLAGEIPLISGGFSIEGCAGGKGLRRNFVARSVQGHPLLHWLTVRGNLDLSAKIRSVNDVDFEGVLAEFSASHLADRYPDTLSGGEKCRASLSQSLIGDPELLLMDEPFVGLDSIVKRSIAENIFSVTRSRGSAAIVISHDLTDAVDHSDRVLVIGGGEPARIVGEVSTSEANALERVRDMLESNP